MLVILLPISSLYYTLTLGNIETLIFSSEVKNVPNRAQKKMLKGGLSDKTHLPSPKAEDTQVISNILVAILTLKSFRKELFLNVSIPNIISTSISSIVMFTNP